MSAESQPTDTPADDGAQASTSEPVNPMLQTALTKRFQGRYQPMQMPTPEQIMGEDLMNNCLVKCLLSGVGGGVLGVAFGIFTASLDTSHLDDVRAGAPAKPTRVVLRESLTLMKEKALSYSRGFALMGLLFSGSECVIEKYRAKHDRWNAVLAGCSTGGMMAAPGGAKAMGMGCASFAAFSFAIDHFMDGH